MSVVLGQIKRVLILFVVGSVIGVVLNIVQMEYEANMLSANFMRLLETTWLGVWVVPFCGLMGVYMGMCYPYLDHFFGDCRHKEQEWTLTIRCVAVFLGFNHMCAKVTFSNWLHFFLILISLSAVYWFLFDRTLCTLIVSLVNALVVMGTASVLNNLKIINYSASQFSYLQICLMPLVFSGGVCFANIGRLVDFDDYHHKKQAGTKKED